MYRGSLLYFIGDTPAANMVAGFKEGVGGAEKKCRTCYGSSQEILLQVFVVPSHFVYSEQNEVCMANNVLIVFGNC